MSDGNYCRFCGEPALVDQIAELEQNFFSRDRDCAAKDILIEQQEEEIAELKGRIKDLEAVAEAALPFAQKNWDPYGDRLYNTLFKTGYIKGRRHVRN